jgi:hypothetical protein
MWTAPVSQEDLGMIFDQIACVHMSGFLLRSRMNASQDGLRDSSPKQVGDLDRPLASSACLASWIDRSHHLLITLQVLASAQYGGVPRSRAWLISLNCARQGGGGFRRVSFACDHQFPGNAGQLVSQRHGDQLRRLTLEKLLKPRC